MECTVALPSLTMKRNLLLGNSSLRYCPDFNVKGSLLQRLGAGSPCLATTSRMKEEMAEARTSSVRPASSNLMLSLLDFFQCDLIWSNLGTTLVSSPHLTSGCASNIALINVVPLLGTPPMNINGDCLSYSYNVPSCEIMEVFLLMDSVFGQSLLGSFPLL